MSVERVKNWLGERGIEGVMEFDSSSATVELAALAVGVESARIAKTMSFYSGESAIAVVTAGDARTDNKKFKQYFGYKARMLAAEDVERLTGFRIGGVSPFDLRDGVTVYLDKSLRRFDTVFPACGSGSSAIEIAPDALQRVTGAQWVDVCSGYAGE